MLDTGVGGGPLGRVKKIYYLQSKTAVNRMRIKERMMSKASWVTREHFYSSIHCLQDTIQWPLVQYAHKGKVLVSKFISIRESKGNQQEKKTKYDSSFTVKCPECHEDVNVGTAGPNGLIQHQGKKPCREAKKRKDEQARTRTLFDVGVKKIQQPKGTVQPTTAGWDVAGVTSMLSRIPSLGCY